MVTVIGSKYRRIDKFHQCVGNWDAQSYGAIVGFGVPIMGALELNPYQDAIVAAAFFAVLAPMYWWIETGWIISEIRRKGLIDTDDASYQNQTMQFLYWGVVLAVVIWALCFVAHFSVPSYGFWEWAILGHTVFVARTSISVLYTLISDYLQATSIQRRVERDN